MKKKAAIGISFQWIFAILIGIFIVGGTIYGVTKFMGSDGAIASTKQSKDFATLLNPLELGFENSKSILLNVPLETKITNYCYDSPGLGRQQFSFSQEIYNQYTKGSTRVSSNNNYIFSEEILEGKNFYAISTKFEFPYDVASLISLISANENYCFFDTPINLEKNLKSFNQSNFFFDDEDCPEESTKICFEDECDIYVDERDKVVHKIDGSMVYYETDSLLIAAIFSDSDIYECQLKRILSRTSKLSELYAQKLIFYSGCNSDINIQLQELRSRISDYSSSEDLVTLIQVVERLNNKNEDMSCRLW